MLKKSRFVEMFGSPLTNEKKWPVKTWEEAITIVNGRNQKKVECDNGQYPICGSGGEMGRANDYLTRENSVIIGRKGNINNPILMKEKFWNVDTAFGLEPNSEMLNVDYLYEFCRQFDFERLNKTVTIPSLTKADLLKIEIPIPPLDLQNRYSEFKDQLDKLKVILEKIDEKFELLKKSRFVELFGEPNTNSLNLPLKRFDEICENLDSKRIPITSSDRKEGKYPYYGASGVVDWVDEYIFDEDLLLISEDGANLVARVSPIAFSVKGKTWVNNHAHVLRFKEYALQKYVEFYFNSINISSMVSGTAQPKLNQKMLNERLIPIPSKEKLEEFTNFWKQLDKLKVDMVSKLLQLV